LHLRAAQTTRRHNNINNPPAQHRSPPSTPPQKALAPARRSCPPNTLSLQIPQSHMCGTANARVSSERSNITNRQSTSPLTQFHNHCTPTALTPQHRFNPSKHTQHAHPAHSPPSKPIKIPRPHPSSHKNVTQTRAPTIIPSMHKRKHTTRARTYPAATMTTPELSPDTATGVSRSVVVASPSCADHKASQQHQ